MTCYPCMSQADPQVADQPIAPRNKQAHASLPRSPFKFQHIAFNHLRTSQSSRILTVHKYSSSIHRNGTVYGLDET